MKRSCLSVALLTLACAALPARAERPMAVDDAGTLDKGGAKLEFGWSKDDRSGGIDGAAGFAPIEHLELEINFSHARDDATDPDTRANATGFAAKWVPLQQDTGLSAGLKFELGHDRSNDGATVEKSHTRALTALASWHFESGHIVHANLGHEWERIVGGASTDASTWGLGFEQPLREDLQLTLETYGRDQGQSRPDKQVGLRWEVKEGLKFSAAIGRGNSRGIANAGVAWEF